ncbi:MAG: hypothetical protein ACI4EU_08725 [Butyrivibrio sp.]
MNLVGKWKIKEVLSFSPDKGMVWKTLDELLADGEDEDSVSKYRNTVTQFNEDGTVEDMMPVPADYTKEQIDELAAGGMKVRDNMAVIDTGEWKTEDGKNLYNTGQEGEILGEEVSPWIEIQEIDDMIEIQFLRYVRA